MSRNIPTSGGFSPRSDKAHAGRSGKGGKRRHGPKPTSASGAVAKRQRFLPRMELLEDRCVPSTMTDGPLVGGVTDTSARIFSRTDVSASVAIEYSTSPTLAGAMTTPATMTSSVHDFTSIIQVSGLQALTKYYYAILVNGVAQETSAFPSFTTFPTAGADVPFSFSVFSDLETTTTMPNDPAPAYGAGVSLGSAFALQIGDFDHRNPPDLAAMRLMDRQVRGPYDAAGADFAKYIAANIPFDHIFDDHDYGQDNGNQFWSGKQAAIQSYKEYYPTYDLANPTNGIWHSFSYGQADVFMLDLRTQRDSNAVPDGPTHSMLNGTHIPNGEKEWLKAGLLASKAKWKFIATSVPFNPTAKGNEGDSWAGYQFERADLLNFIKSNHIDNVILFSGDLHSGGGIDDGTNSGLPEVATPHTNIVGQTGSGALGIWSQGIVKGSGNPGFDYIQVFSDHVILQTRGADGTLRISYTINSVSPPAPGPAVWSVLVSPHPVSMIPPTVFATLEDPRGSNVVAAEFFLNTVGANGTGTALAAKDGNFDSPHEDVLGTLDSTLFASLPDGGYVTYVHGLDAAGNWGTFEVTNFFKDTVGPLARNVSAEPDRTTTTPPLIKAFINDGTTGGSAVAAAEYFVDTIGTNGTGIALQPEDGSFIKSDAHVKATLDASLFASLSIGKHTVFVHGEDAALNWGNFKSAKFTKRAGANLPTAFADLADPMGQPPVPGAQVADRPISAASPPDHLMNGAAVALNALAATPADSPPVTAPGNSSSIGSGQRTPANRSGRISHSNVLSNGDVNNGLGLLSLAALDNYFAGGN